jgi:hypothetical protein
MQSACFFYSLHRHNRTCLFRTKTRATVYVNFLQKLLPGRRTKVEVHRACCNGNQGFIGLPARLRDLGCFMVSHGLRYASGTIKVCLFPTRGCTRVALGLHCNPIASATLVQPWCKVSAGFPSFLPCLIPTFAAQNRYPYNILPAEPTNQV